MTKAGFWKKDWFLGLAVAFALLLAGGSQILQSLERSAYDWGVRATTRLPSDRVAVIAIDEQALADIGRWPWSRAVLAKMTDGLANANAKVIAYTDLFSEPELNPGLDYIARLIQIYSRIAPMPTDAAVPVHPGEVGRIGTLLREAETGLNADRKLAGSFAKAGNVVLPILFLPGEPRGKPDRPLPDFVARNALTNISRGEDLPIPGKAVQYPVEVIGKAAAALGHFNQKRDADGAIRAELLVVGHSDRYFPSLALMIAARSLDLGIGDINVQPGEGVRLGNLRISADPTLQMKPYFYEDRDDGPAFQVDSFYDVYSGKIPFEKYRDKIVLIGATAPGLVDSPATPISSSMAPVLTLAHVVSSILNENFFVAPTWGWIFEKLVFLLIAAYLIALLPRLSAGRGVGVTAGIAALLLVTYIELMTGQGVWLQFMQPIALLVVGHVLLIAKRFVVIERGMKVSDAQSAANARMLGLAFQGQGQLDMAFDYFRKVPLDDALMDNIYNLALDFERKGQSNKAEAVFRYMAGYNPRFRDLETRLSRARKPLDILALGGAGAEKQMLGRYQVEKELGKGSMSVVYLGKDPKIGRVVAIKTLKLSQEFEADEVAEVKERFFREAETAGRLSHPNIVTIYDAGEERDLCYIAMELLEGRDLVPFISQGDTLPLEKVVSIVARVADALGYAHRQNVVHRDVKPANIMYEPENDVVKVTDFGIARITDSSKTRTGMVLGTPSYMSPEQLAGKKIDGRSDLFSLAVSLYQLACGKLPFEGDPMAQLMFRIANAQAPDILQFNPNLPPAFVSFLDKVLSKNPDRRYQTGEEFAAALRASLSKNAAALAGAGVDISL